MLEFIKYLLFIAPNLAIFLPFIIAAINFKKYPKSLKHITQYLTLSVAIQIVSFILWKLKKNNYPILHAYTLLEYFVLLKYYSVLLKDFFSKTVFKVLLFLFPLYSIFDSIFIESLFTFNTYSRSIEALILITMSVCLFIKNAGDTDEERAASVAHNYINSGFLIYFAGSIMLFSYSSYVARMVIASRINLWIIHSFLAAQLYILITIGLWKVRTR